MPPDSYHRAGHQVHAVRWFAVWALCAGAALTVGCGRSPQIAQDTGSSDLAAISDDSESPITTIASEPTGGELSGGPHDKVAKGIDDAIHSLDELADAIRACFETAVTLQEQIYPKGWSQRRNRVVRVEALPQVAPSDQEGEPHGEREQGTVRIVYQRLYSMIHPTRAEAEADQELVPISPAPSLREMTNNPLLRRWPEVTVEIRYERIAGSWRRVGWSAEPDAGEVDDWLDRLGIP